ncbi:MAG: helix-turn-helix domain-containing protein, partial [Solirubrobacteraceae bacterium]
MASSPDATKLTALRVTHSVHPRAAAVSDGAFRSNDFFDPRDLVQVKYEMVRRVQREGVAVTAATHAFGLSRPTFYQAQAAFARAGLPGLLARRRGPRQPHKFDPAVQAFLAQTRAAEPTLSAAALARRIQDRFGRSVHPRSVQRLLAGTPKKGANRSARPRRPLLP